MVRSVPQTVADLMSTRLVTVAAEAPLERAARVMEEQGIRQLPVVDHDGRLLGMLSYRPLLHLLTARRTPDLERGLTVGGIMDDAPPAFAPQTPLVDAIRRMLDEGLTAVPVVEGERLVGLVSEHDLVRVAGRLLEDAGPEA